MLEAMRQVALDALWVELDEGRSPDPEQWYQEVREKNPGRLFSKLVEDVEQEVRKDKQRYYTLHADTERVEVSVLSGHEFKGGDAGRLPFNQPSGSQAAALGPVIKRSAPSRSKEAGPSVKIQTTTLAEFDKIAQAGQPWSPYFQAARACFLRPKIEINGEVINAPGGAFLAAISRIDEKRTVLLAFQDERGRLPGEVPEYVEYLQGVLSRTKYATGAISPCEGKACSLCGRQSVTVYPNALRGAGINLANLDRDGAFPGLDPSAAWKGFGLCVGCADLLYIYWNHVAADYRTTIAGYKALVVPSLRLDAHDRQKFARRLRDWVSGVDQATTPIVVRENLLLKLLGDDQAVATLSILWAEFGQRIDDIQGVVTDILPSRLRALEDFNRQIKALPSHVFPECPVEEEVRYDLPLTILRSLLRRPGGKAAQKSNEGRRLFDLRRDVADAIYHAGPLPERFFDEVHEAAQWHFGEVMNADRPAWLLLNEGRKKDGTTFVTLAGWVRELARFQHYLRLIGVMRMPDSDKLYRPACEALKPYCGPQTAIDSPAKAFAFVLGALYGKLLQVQSARGVNVVSNALTWLKRLTLAGKDLPELYVKVREKMMLYGTEGNEAVRQLVTELGELGSRLGTDIMLDETQTCYFLLLGQSLATKIMPPKQQKDGEGESDE
jgi:CRISPR-associated protein Csh1